MVVQDGLVGYWYYDGSLTNGQLVNSAPEFENMYNINITGATPNSDYLYFDGVDDVGVIPIISSMNITGDFESEIIFSSDFPTGEVYNILGYANAGFNSKGQFVYEVFMLAIQDGNTIGTINSSTGIPVTIPRNQIFSFGMSKTGQKISYFVNGQHIHAETLISSYTVTTPGRQQCGLASTGPSFSNNIAKMNFKSLKIYNRNLTDSERNQNFQNFEDLGLSGSEPLPPSPPSVTISDIITPNDNDKISDETNMNIAQVKFSFDMDVSQWKVKVLGTSHDTGTLADSGGSVSTGTEITAEIDWTELYQEGDNRINIYGLSTEGEWTQYEP
jgi:hypothetical protein